MAQNRSVRKIALSLLLEYEGVGKYVNLSLSSHKADGLSPEERSFLTALLYTAVERKLTYDYYISALSGRSIDKIDETTKNILRLGLCQLLSLDGVPDFAAINESVLLARNAGERAFVNGILRSAQRQRDNLPLPDKNKNYARYLSVRYSFPLWIVKKFISLFGVSEAEELLSHIGEIPSTDLTVNLAKTSREQLCERLISSGFSAELSELSPITVRVRGSVDPRRLPGYSEGEFFVQDAACAAAVSILGAKSGDTLVDVCACPGGKSFAASVLMGGEGRIYSFDLHESKLSLIEDGAKRLGLENISAVWHDSRLPRPELISSADCVICDVPCSGLGVLGKKPDLRYKEEDGITELPALQYEILSSSAEYLRTGGRMIYSTCTLCPEENRDVVDRFLSEHKDFRTVDFCIGRERSTDGSFTFLPHKHNTDGFFVSLLEKV